MIGHTFFIPAMLIGYREIKPLHIVLGVGICIAFCAASLVMEKIMKMDYGRYRIPVVLYSFFVSGSLVASVIGMIVNGFSEKYILLSAGAAAFLLSDLVLSTIYFKEGGNTKLNVIVNHTLYYFAQFAFAATLLLQ